MWCDAGSLFLPPPSSVDLVEPDVWRWFGNIPAELALLALTEEERASVTSYYVSAGLMKKWRRPFFRHHYCLPLLEATRALFGAKEEPRVLDLGCGIGTQSLLFALLGAHVIAADMDEMALGVLLKRKTLYEQRSGRRLSIDVLRGNAFEVDFSRHAPIDAVYSLFAFNMMQPTRKLLDRLVPHLSKNAAIVIQEGNRDHFYDRFLRRRFLSPGEFQRWLHDLGFDDCRRIGGYAIPPPLWAIGPRWLLEPADRLLARSGVLAASYLHIAKR